MIHALGVAQNPFDPADPGRLCRGRERWIDPWELPSHPMLSRLVVSGASFDDDSARDARRGLPFAGIDLASLIGALFPRKPLLAFMEDGHPADIPENAEGIEAWSGSRAGGRSEEVMVRWHLKLTGITQLRQALGADSPEITAIAESFSLPNELACDVLASERVRGFAVLQDDQVSEELLEKLFLFVGMSTLDSPPARYQPGALPELLDSVKAVIALHRDKHGPAVAVYTKEPLELGVRLQNLCDKLGVLLVPFAIPPMLARWDRAISDLRRVWTRPEPFPVPVAAAGNRWEPRRRRRGRGDEMIEELTVPMEDEPVPADLEVSVDGGEE